MSRVSFNYESIEDVSTRKAAPDAAHLIRGMLAKTGRSIIEIGKRLQEMFDGMGRQTFDEWIRLEFEWRHQTAMNYMRANRMFGDNEFIDHFQPVAFFELSRRNIPQKLIDQAFKRAKSGEMVTASWVKAKIKEAEIPRRSDAGQPKTVAEVRVGEAPSVKTMRFVLEEWTSALPKALQEFSPEEVEDLETRIMQLMLQLRTARRPIEPPPVRRPRRTTAVA